MSKNISKVRNNRSKTLAQVSMLLPFLMFFTVFLLIPIIASIVLSFTDFNMVQMPQFVGLKNYARVFFDDDIFMTAFKNTILFAIIIGPIGYILSFVVAWLINELSPRIRSIATMMVYAPALAGNVYVIWTYIFSADRRGFLNNLLIQMGFISEPVAWLTDVTYNFAVVCVVSIWLSFGAGFLSFISGLQALDRSYYEAAAIDGLKNRWQELYYVTFPQIGPQLLFGAVQTISSSFAVGAVSQVLTGFPSTEYSTHTILLHLQDYGNTRYEMGYACSLAVVLFLLMLIAWIGISKLLSKFND